MQQHLVQHWSSGMNLFKWFTPKDPNKKYIYFKEEKMDPISPSYCAAKWYEGTIWLYQGSTANCHHNPFHKIVLDPAKPSSVYNTPQKIEERVSMLNGGKPEGCSYCWATENAGQVSDRIIKTSGFKKHIDNHQLESIPQVLEIAFERTCNLACAYCGPHFSSKWASDVKRNGPYVGLISDSRYSTDSGQDIIDPDNNPYVDAFFAWWPEIESALPVLKITGGEPLMSPSFWKFLDLLNVTKKFKGTLKINTNLINHKDEIERLIHKTKGFKVRMHTSMESSLNQAEYVRDGFDQANWLANVEKILSSTNMIVIISTSINNLAVWSFIDYLNLMTELKIKYGNKRIIVNCNFVHYPIFMRVQMIPQDLRQPLAIQVEEWYDKNIKRLDSTEQGYIVRFIDTLNNAPCSLENTHHTMDDAHKDLKSFIEQYDQRRNKNFRKVLDQRFVEWYDSL